ncbi:MAG: adenylate/guanylate cyclase domain-containing protein [Candidatus Omnitrophota bacterium]
MPIILIVDDEIENLNALKRALNDENPTWEILTAQNEKEGKNILQKQLNDGFPVDVVLTDLVLESEERGGMNILQEARQIDPLIMTILFTAKEKSLDRYAAFDYGAFDVVEKTIRGTSAVREINIKTRAALRYRQWSQRINFLRRYFDPKVFNIIEKDPSLLRVKNRLLTIVFWDIRGFSRLCDILKAHPDLIAGFLKEYSETAAKVIFDHNGVLDKFIGDGVMALFGVLNHKDDNGTSDAISAVNAAVDFRAHFDKVVDKWMEKWHLYVPDKIEIGLGCGIHTGETIAGNVGTDFRDQFTALGPKVNFASRIEARAKKGEILISEPTRNRVKDSFHILKSGEISDIKNIPGTFILYRVKGKRNQ